MGLLDKHNPRATRRTVLLWAAGGAMLGLVVGGAGVHLTDMPDRAAWFILPWMAVWCSIAGAAMERQVPR